MIADAASGPQRAAPPREHTAVLGWIAAGAIVLSVLLMAAVPATGGAGAVPYIPRTLPVPPWWTPLHPSRVPTLLTVYAAVLLGVAGVGCGLVAVRRGARPSARLLLAGSAIAITVLTLVPPAGSTDSLNYAVYGRMAVLGHSPYEMTPLQLRQTGDPVGVNGTRNADTKPSVYGPLATATEWTAAELGGASISRIIFWLKVEFALAYGAVAVALHRLLRRDPAARTRAHLLWSVNPVLLWAELAGAHVDVLASAFCFVGLIIARPAVPDGPRIGAARALAAGALIGIGADFKINYLLLGVGLAWATRRSWADMAAAAAGAALALIPGYLVLARGFLGVVPKENQLVPLDSFWRLLPGFSQLHQSRGLTPVAAVICLALALFLAWRLPPGPSTLPAIRPALAIALAWLFIWPLQHPWYDAMAFCLLAVYVPSWLDWLMLIRAVPTTLAAVPNIAQPFPPHWLYQLSTNMVSPVASVTRLAALAALVVVCTMRVHLPGRPHASFSRPPATGSP
jgi:hypothetical protein